jgi:hypothetical protein
MEGSRLWGWWCLQVNITILILTLLKVWWHAATLFIYFILIEQTYSILYILLVEHHSCCPHYFPLGRGPPLGCWAALTRACRTASRRYYLSHTAPLRNNYISHAVTYFLSVLPTTGWSIMLQNNKCSTYMLTLLFTINFHMTTSQLMRSGLQFERHSFTRWQLLWAVQASLM